MRLFPSLHVPMPDALFKRLEMVYDGDLQDTAEYFSRAIDMAGANVLFVTATIAQLGEVGVVGLDVEGSDDQQNWRIVGSLDTMYTAGTFQDQLSGIATAHVRIRATLTNEEPTEDVLALLAVIVDRGMI